MAARVHGAIEDAYRGLANTQETLILMNHYPLEYEGGPGGCSRTTGKRWRR